MGLGCLKQTSAEIYAPYLAPHFPELKQRWPPILLFKLKRLFEAHVMHGTDKQLAYAPFIALFPEFPQRSYSEVQSI